MHSLLSGRPKIKKPSPGSQICKVRALPQALADLPAFHVAARHQLTADLVTMSVILILRYKSPQNNVPKTVPILLRWQQEINHQSRQNGVLTRKAASASSERTAPSLRRASSLNTRRYSASFSSCKEKGNPEKDHMLWTCWTASQNFD